MNIIDWVEDSTQSVWNVCIKFDTWREHWKMSILGENDVVLNGEHCWYKTM